MVQYSAKILQCMRKLRSDPTCVDAIFTLGVIYASEGHRAKALKCIRRLEALQASYPGLRLLKEKIEESDTKGLREILR